MENEKFLTCLLMSVFGIIILLLIAVFVLASLYNIIIFKPKLEKEGMEVVGEVIYILNHYGKTYKDYSIEYEIKGRQYSDMIRIRNSDLRKGDKILLYYLPNHEDKLYLTKENNVMKTIVAGIGFGIIMFPIAFLGFKCIQRYNVFKYKRNIDVR